MRLPKPVLLSERYRDRHVEFRGVWAESGWRFKMYAITHHGNSPADERTTEIAKTFARRWLNEFGALTPAYGVGYILLHKGMDSNYIVVTWFAGENMICTHSAASPRLDPYNFKSITHTGLNTCVWDALLHKFERDAWVRQIMTPETPDVEKYVSDVYVVDRNGK